MEQNITLLDHYAAHAMQGIISNTEFLIQMGKTEKPMESIAIESYDIAEAMLTERSKRIKIVE